MKLIRITTVPMSLQYLLGGQLNFMQAHGFEVLAISADGKEREAILTSGIRHQVIPFTRKITPLQDLLCLWQLIKVFSKEKPDIVHTHTPKAGLLGMLAAFFCRVPVRLHTVAGLPLMEAGGLKRSLLALTEKITYAAAHQVYPNSKGLQNFIQSAFKLNSSKMKMIANGSSNGIDTTYFTAHDALRTAAKAIRIQNGVPAHACVFLFIGRVVRDKGIHELLQAFKNINKKRDDVYLFLVGPLEQELDPLDAAALNYMHESNNIILTGFQKDVRPWLLASDVFVFPSYREGFPNVVMQAACMEIPCIVSDINGCNELIQHEESGLIVPPKNTEALQAAMEKLKNEAQLRIQFANKAADFVRTHFSQQYVWQALLEEYQVLLKQK